jgi:hypothetical protein
MAENKKMKLGIPNELRIKPINGKKRFRFLLRFPERTQPVEFETGADDAMAIMKALQRIQELYKLPIPQGPLKKGKPALSIVKDDE